MMSAELPSVNGGCRGLACSNINRSPVLAPAWLHAGHSALIITGAARRLLGAILSYIMCKGMNRSFISVILGGFGGEVAGPGGGRSSGREARLRRRCRLILKNAGKVIILPGYGMAVAQAQHALRGNGRPASRRRRRNQIRHPSGRPAACRHMNVLLAEAKRSLRRGVRTRGHQFGIRPGRCRLVMGANERDHPAARRIRPRDLRHAGAGVWKAGTVMFPSARCHPATLDRQHAVLPRKHMMLFGDAKKMTEEIVKAL